jgi:hypothetical protein
VRARVAEHAALFSGDGAVVRDRPSVERPAPPVELAPRCDGYHESVLGMTVAGPLRK